MLCRVVRTVDAPPFLLHLLGVVVVCNHQTVCRNVFVPSCLLTVLKDKPFHSGSCFASWLCVDEAGLVVGDALKRNVLRIEQFLDVGTFAHPSHLHTLECHEAWRCTALVVVATRSVETVVAGVKTHAVVVAVRIVHILQTQNVSELVCECSDAVHRRNCRSAWHADKLSRTRIVVHLYAVIFRFVITHVP